MTTANNSMPVRSADGVDEIQFLSKFLTPSRGADRNA